MNKKTAPAQTKNTAPSTTQRVWAWVKNGCCWFTLLCMGMLLLNLIFWNTNGVTPLRYLLLLPMGMAFSAAGMARRSGMSNAPRYALHLLLIVGGVYLFGLMPYLVASNASPFTSLVLVLLVLLVYGIGVAIATPILRATRGKRENQTTYQSQFKKQD